jgi:hypothetical protein
MCDIMMSSNDSPPPALPPWRAPRSSEPATRIEPLNMPQPLEVEADERGAPLAVATREGLRRVEAIQDVWRVDDEWWRTTVSRRYFMLRLESGLLRVVFQDLTTGAWHVQRY